jgi:hypothetical protein
MHSLKLNIIVSKEKVYMELKFPSWTNKCN